MPGANGTIVNEIAWAREESAPVAGGSPEVAKH
jgi:hypothetical protein